MPSRLTCCTSSLSPGLHTDVHVCGLPHGQRWRRPDRGSPPPTRQAEVNRWPVRRATASSQSYTKARPKSTYHYLPQARSSTSVTSQKCRDPGSSRGPSDLQSDALPAELSRLMLLTYCAQHASGQSVPNRLIDCTSLSPELHAEIKAMVSNRQRWRRPGSPLPQQQVEVNIWSVGRVYVASPAPGPAPTAPIFLCIKLAATPL